MPNLAAMIMVATLLYCLFLYGGGQFVTGDSLLRDSDTGWHIRNGEAIIAQHALPVTDPYSFSKPNQPWFAWEWGADVVDGSREPSRRVEGSDGVVRFCDRMRFVALGAAEFRDGRGFSAGGFVRAADGHDGESALAGAAARVRLDFAAGVGDLFGKGGAGVFTPEDRRLRRLGRPGGLPHSLRRVMG